MSTFDVFNPLQNLIPRFTEEQLSQILEWFDNQAKPLLVINDGEPINVITIENLKQFLELKKFHRRSFYYPSYAEIMKEAENLNAGTTRMLTKEQLIYMLDKWIIESNIKHEIKLAFQVFDTEKRNFLEIDEIKVIVTAYAEAFNEAEIREMLRDANVSGDGNVFYNDFVDSLFNIAPELHQIKVFDTEKRNFLEIDEIKVIVTAYAEAFNEAEIREMLRDANVSGDGNVFYNDFVDSLFNIAPELHQIKTEYLYEDPEDDPSVPPEPVIEEEPPMEKPTVEKPPVAPPPPPPPAKKKQKK